jgi:hypothetical protein
MRNAFALAILLSLGAASGAMAQGSTKQDNTGSGASQYAPGQQNFKGGEPGASEKAPGQQDFKDKKSDPGASEFAPGQRMRDKDSTDSTDRKR